jgi:hypothetical protein
LVLGAVVVFVVLEDESEVEMVAVLGEVRKSI